ncbi:MAG: exo-alpha-sialidase [Candidatus Latescibacteria bacterium]|nr:exo-alpha-sialidase [Candidatus Latescibacterota bacterium]
MTTNQDGILFEDIHVVPMPKGRFGYRGMPGDIVPLQDGTLLMCYTREGIVGRTSSDKGRTWSDESVLVPNPGPPSAQGYYGHPSFLRLPQGDILLSYIYNAQTEPYYAHNYYRRSADEGKTWSEQFVLTPYPGYIMVHNAKLRLLSDGRIIAPAEYKKERPSSDDHSDFAVVAAYSDTNGYSWQMSGNDVDILPHEAQEPHVVELKDGRVMLLFRTYSGFVGRAYSTDRGETWSAGELVRDLPLSKRTSAVSVDRIPATGDLLVMRCIGEGGGPEGRYRTPFVAAVSRDEGRTWINERVIAGDPEDDYGYQSVLFMDDVAIISYHARDGLHVARIGIDWYYGRN